MLTVLCWRIKPSPDGLPMRFIWRSLLLNFQPSYCFFLVSCLEFSIAILSAFQSRGEGSFLAGRADRFCTSALMLFRNCPGWFRRFFFFLSMTDELLPLSLYFITSSLTMILLCVSATTSLIGVGTSDETEGRFEFETFGVFCDFLWGRIIFACPFSFD